MVERRDFGPVAGQMRAALEKYSREELADLLTHILRVYVIEGKEPSLAVGQVSADDNLRTLSFPQLILHLQMNLPHAELKTLRVSGDRVWAERGGREVLIAGEPLENPEMPPDWEELAPREAPAAARGRRRGVRAATGPVYRGEETPSEPPPGTPRRRRAPATPTPASISREAGSVPRPSVALKEEEPQAAPSRERAAPSAPLTPVAMDWGREMGGASPQASEPAGKPEDDVTELSDRFSMLELD